MELFMILDKVQQARFLALDKAQCMAEDIETGYFDKLEIKTPEDMMLLAYSYRNYQTKVFILQDYLQETERLLVEAEDALNAAYEASKTEAKQKPTCKPTEQQAALLALLEGLQAEDVELLARTAKSLHEHREGVPA